MKKRICGLTMTVVVEGESMNHGEGFGNLSTLKTSTRGDGSISTKVSREALFYSLKNGIGWNDTPVIASGSGDNKVVQYDPSATIIDYPEIDLGGYMKTAEGSGNTKTRNAVCRLSNAISLEPFQMDMNFLNNMGLAKRGGFDNSIAQSESHRSFYAYTATIDLDRVGIDGDLEVDDPEKANRVKTLLDGFKFLYRDIKGRRENLTPLFIIGGVYERKNPFFEGRIKLDNGAIVANPILDTLSLDESISANTIVGLTKGIFQRDQFLTDALQEKVLAVKDVKGAFEHLKTKVDEYYETN